MGVYSDFSQITSQSVRLMGKGMAVIVIPDTALNMKTGVWYINRELIKLLPAGGFVWKPARSRSSTSSFPIRSSAAALHLPDGTDWRWYLSGELWRRGVDHQAFARPHESGFHDGERPDRPRGLRRYPRRPGR